MNAAPIRTASQFAIGLLIAALVLHTWFVMGLIVPVIISGSSMAPTLGDEANLRRVLIDRTAFLFRDPRRWDVVVFRCPNSADNYCVKRIVALPNETVTLAAGDVFVDGQLVVNPLSGGEGPDGESRKIYYGVRRGDRPERVDDRDVKDIPWPDPVGPGRAATWKLGPGEYFVIGDNTAVSDDSRSWVSKAGLDAKLLLGKPFGVR